MGNGYDESDSFIDNSEAVSTGAGVRVVKGSCLGGSELAPGENPNWVQARSVPGLGNERSWGNHMAGECWLAGMSIALSVLGGAQIPRHSPSSSATE